MDQLDRMTQQAGQMLGRELDEVQPDLRRLRELSGLVKELNALRRELQANEPRELTVRFDQSAEEYGV